MRTHMWVTIKFLLHYMRNSHVNHMKHRLSRYLNSVIRNFDISMKLHGTTIHIAETELFERNVYIFTWSNH